MLAQGATSEARKPRAGNADRPFASPTQGLRSQSLAHPLHFTQCTTLYRPFRAKKPQYVAFRAQ